MSVKLTPCAAAALATALLCVCGGVRAQTVAVPDGTDLGTLGTPAATTIWQLQGNATLTSQLSLPLASSGLTVQGASGGSSVALTTPGRFSVAVSGPYTLNLSNVTLTGGNANSLGTANGGGAVYASTGADAVTIAASGNLTLSHNTGANGGAIDKIGAGALTITGNGGSIELSDNQATSAGGAIEAAGAFTIDNPGGTVDVLRNTASTGSGGAIAAVGAVTILGRQIAIADNTSSSVGGAISGSAITIGDASTQSVTVNHNTLAAATGGAIRANEAAVSITGANVSITNNSDQSNGGAIWSSLISSSQTGVAIDGDTISIDNNHALSSGSAGQGGAIFARANVTIGDANSSSVSLTNNSSDLGGGAIMAYASPAASGTVTVNGRNIDLSNNSTGSGNGAGIYGGGQVVIGNSGSTVVMNRNINGTDLGGAVASTAVQVHGSSISLTNNSAGYGGALFSEGGGVALGDPTSTVNATGNTADYGGAIYSTSDVTVSGHAITFANNGTGSGNGGAIDANGNLILGNADNSTATLTLTGNSNAFGGGLIAFGNATLYGNTITLSNNVANAGSGGAIYTVGDTTIGGAGSTLTLTGNTATEAGGAIYSQGNVTLTGTDISNNSAAGDGGAVFATNDFTLSATTNDTITNNSAGGNGGALWVGGNATLNATSGDITFSGNTSNTATATQANAIWLDNSNGAAVATLSAAAGHTITFYDPLASNPDNGLVEVLATGPGAVVFDGSLYTSATDQWSKVYGGTEVQGGTFAVQNNAIYGTLAADLGETALTSFTVDPGATLAGGVQGEVRADNLTLGGTLDVSGSTALGHATGTSAGGFGNMTLTSSHVNLAAGSRVLFNTWLNDGSTPLTDTLTLNLNGSATTGTASVIVTNTGGPGGLTTGDGIQLVATNNGTSAGAFTLGRAVEGGAYQYLLYRGGVGADASNENWYLRSHLEPPPVVPPPVVPPPVEPPPVEPPPVPPPPEVVVPPEQGPVAWRPGVVGYTMTPLLNLEYGFTTLGTLHQRVGDVPGAIDPRQSAARNGVWGRVDAASFDADALGRFRADSATYFAQFGKDWTLDQRSEGGSTHAGVTVTLGNTSGTFHDDLRPIADLATETGTVSTQAESIGGYWTRYLKDGTYFDSVGQLTYYRNRYGGLDGSPSQGGVGAALSQEVGKPFQIGATPVAIEPQAQLMYEYLSLGDFNDAVSPVSGTHTNALRGRLGFRVFGANLQNGDDRGSGTWAKPYFTFNLLHDFLRPGQTVVGDTQFNPTLSRTRYDVGAGVTATAGKHGAVYAHGGYQHSIGGDGESKGFYGQIAYRYMW